MKIELREYNRVHKWIGRKWIKSGKCEHCQKTTKTQWANKDGQYKIDRKDWLELCVKCHYATDINIHKNSKVGRKRIKPYRLPPRLTYEIRYTKIIYKDDMTSLAKRISDYAWHKATD
jgi:hypothetical protein